VKNHYETLGVSPQAAVQVIRESYQLLSQSYATEKLSGDVTSVDSKIAAIDEAYSILTDSEARAEYDKVYKIYISHQDFDLLVLKDPSLAGKVKKHFFQLFSRLAQLYESLRRSSNRWIAFFCGIFLLFGCALFLVYEGNNLSGLNSTKSTSRDEARQKFEDEIGAEGSPSESALAKGSGEKLVDSQDKNGDASGVGQDVGLNQRIAPRPEPKPTPTPTSKSALTESYDAKNVITNASDLSADLLNFVRGQIQNRIPNHSYIELTYENGNQGQGRVLWMMDDRHECSWPHNSFIERLEYYCLTFMDLSTDIIGFSLLYGPELPTLIGETGYELSGDILNFSSATNFRVIEIQ